MVTKGVPAEVQDRYLYSQYVIDPNRHDFMEVVTVLSLVYKFFRKLKEKRAATRAKQTLGKDFNVTVDERDKKEAEQYYFKKATAEIKQFVTKEGYEKISQLDDGVLMFTGRILPT